jgi:[ribosomal protein S5]-alanine N-acetyltransferase
MPFPSVLPFPDPPLTHGATTLRAWTPDDLDALVEAGRDEQVRRFRHSLPSGAAEAADWLERAEQGRRTGDRIELAITTTEAEATTALGSVSVWNFHPRNRTAYVSYWLLASARGRGHATKAVALAARYAFGTLDLERLTARVETANRPSQRVVERAGFQLEGTLRADAIDDNGDRVDVNLYGLLRTRTG